MKILITRLITLTFIMSISIFAQGGWTDGGSVVRLSTYSDKVGIGISNVGSKMQVNGNVAIGYSVNTTAPQNGLIVKGAIISSTAIMGNKILPVTAFGAAVSNPDNTSYFQAALNAARDSGGTIVFVPSGRWNINGTLSIPTGVTLMGCSIGPDYFNNAGTILLTTNGAGSENGSPFITMQWGSSVNGLTIFYPNQNNVGSIKAYPFTISANSGCNIFNVTLANSFNGINITNQHGQVKLQNVNMTALRFGVVVDNAWDVDILENVHISNSFMWNALGLTSQQQNELRNYTQNNLWAYRIGNVDGLLMDKCFAIWSYCGIYLSELSPPPVNDPNPYPWVHVSNTIIDEGSTHLAVMVERCHPFLGISFNNCGFSGSFEIGANNEGPIRVSSCYFHFDGNQEGLLVKKFGEGTLSITNSRFFNWTTEAVRVISGAAIIGNSDFQNTSFPTGTKVRVLSGARASVVNCHLQGSEGLIAEQGAIIVSSSNLFP